MRPISRAKPRCRFGQRSEHRLQIERGATDDPEDISSGGLLLQRFGELPRALLFRLEQPRVLDCDDGLVGERGHQFYLFPSKWIRLCAPSEKIPIVVPSRRSGTLRVLLYPASS